MWDITAHADRIENIKAGGSRSKKVTLKVSFYNFSPASLFHSGVYHKVNDKVAKLNKDSTEKKVLFPVFTSAADTFCVPFM